MGTMSSWSAIWNFVQSSRLASGGPNKTTPPQQNQGNQAFEHVNHSSSYYWVKDTGSLDYSPVLSPQHATMLQDKIAHDETATTTATERRRADHNDHNDNHYDSTTVSDRHAYGSTRVLMRSVCVSPSARDMPHHDR